MFPAALTENPSSPRAANEADVSVSSTLAEPFAATVTVEASATQFAGTPCTDRVYVTAWFVGFARLTV